MNENQIIEIEKSTKNENEDIIIKKKNSFKSDTNLVNIKTFKADLATNNFDRKSVNSIDITNNERRKESESSSNLNNLSLLFKSYIQKNKFNNQNFDKRKGRRTILPINKIYKNITIKENEEILKEEMNDENLNLYNIIKDRILDAKREILQYLEDTKNKLEIKYNNYINNLNELLIEKESRLSKILDENADGDNFINYANDNLFKQIDDIFIIHDYIFNALEDHINLLYSFLDQSNLINQKKPVEYFIYNNSSDILNSWLLNKFDFNQIDLSKIILNKELADLFAGYFSKMNNNEYSSISLQKNDKENFPLEIDLLNKNINNVKKIKFIGLSKDDIIKINEEINKKIKNKKGINENKSDAKKVRSLSLINCDFNKNNPISIKFPVLKIFKLRNTFLDPSYMFKYFISETNSLIKIHIEKINLTDNDLKIFFQLLSKRNEIQNALKTLSFKGNILTKISLDNFNMNNCVLKNLQYLNFSKNNIYEFSEKIFRSVPELKVIDLTNNNISNKILFDFLKEGNKIFKFIALLSNNIFIHNNHSNNMLYIKYISDNLSSFQHGIKKLSLSFLFNKKNINYLTKLKISPAVKISLFKLDLSFCGLKDENVLKFLKNNFGLFNLQILNLSNNHLTDNFFNLGSGLKEEILLEKLKILDLSSNNINLKEIKDLKALNNFVENHRDLKKIKLQYTNFIEGLRNLIGNDGMKIYKEESNMILKYLMERNIIFILESELKSNIIVEIYSTLFNLKDKIY